MLSKIKFLEANVPTGPPRKQSTSCIVNYSSNLRCVIVERPTFRTNLNDEHSFDSSKTYVVLYRRK